MERVIIATAGVGRAEQTHIHTDTGETGDERRLDHVTREARVLADDDEVAPVWGAAEQLAGGETDSKRDLRGHGRGVGAAANAVRAEIGALGATRSH